MKKETILIVPYQGRIGERLMKALKLYIDKLEENRVTNVIYTGAKLGSNFNIKDPTAKEHEYNLVYQVTCPEATCSAIYERLADGL